jgi:hypothetical protein
MVWSSSSEIWPFADCPESAGWGGKRDAGPPAGRALRSVGSGGAGCTPTRRLTTHRQGGVDSASVILYNKPLFGAGLLRTRGRLALRARRSGDPECRMGIPFYLREGPAMSSAAHGVGLSSPHPAGRACGDELHGDRKAPRDCGASRGRRPRVRRSAKPCSASRPWPCSDRMCRYAQDLCAHPSVLPWSRRRRWRGAIPGIAVNSGAPSIVVWRGLFTAPNGATVRCPGRRASFPRAHARRA